MNTQEFEKLAKQYEKMSTIELEEEFQKQLSIANQGKSSPTRGGTFWEETKKSIIEGILQNRDLGSATIGMITSEVLAKLSSAGVDLSQYKLAIAVFIGIVARAVWKAIEEQSKKP